MRWAYLCLMALLLPLSVAGAQQTGTVAGTVTDGSGRPLVGAQVTVPGTNLGTLANEQGRFLIPGVPVGPQTVRATLLGYGQATQQVTVAAGQTATTSFQLTVEAVELEGIVAVGYGTQRKENMTGAVATVEVDEAARLPVPTVTHALQGMSPGLQLLDGGNRPGRNVLNLLIRGQGTLGRGGNMGDAGAARPLVLIDGIEGDMANLDINDVANISILKDAASAAIYGSRAANGVILITTKRGTALGQPQITYSGYYGIQTPTAWPETVGSVRHMELRNIARTNLRNWCIANGGSNCEGTYANTYTQGAIDSTRMGVDPFRYPNTNWFDEQFDPAPMQDHTLRIAGGSETARYALSLDYMREDGMMATTGADRYGARLNTDFDVSERLRGGFDVALSRRWSIVPALNWNSTFFLIHDTPPTRYVTDENGVYGTNLFGYNPIAYARESGDQQESFAQGTITGRVNYDLVPEWLEVQGLAAYRHEDNSWEYYRTDSRYIDTWPGVRWGPNRLDTRAFGNDQLTLRALANFGHAFSEGTHDVSGVLGYEQIHNEWEEFRAMRNDFYSNDLRRLNLGNADTDENWGAANEWALRSVFGRVNYTLLGRYLFEANARYDGSSRFAQGDRYGLFPSFSAGWRISEESFFNVPWVNELKLRASWGQLGNQDVPLYTYYSSVQLTQPYWFGDQVHTGAAISDLSNPDLSWETTTATDIGFDAAFLNSRLNLTADWYTRRTEDILLRVPIPSMVGRAAPFLNAGVVENKGWELSVGWRDSFRDANYSVDFNLADNQNEVVDLYGTGPFISGESVVMEGQPINSWYGYEVDGFFRNQAEIDAHAQPTGYITRPGDLVFVDQNNDGVINEADRTIIGNPNPRYMFGLNLSADWRGFDAAAFFQGIGKRDQYLALGFIQGPVWENFTSEWHNDYYDPELDNQDARHPTYYANVNRNYYSVNENWILDGSFVKLRNVQLGYSLPENVAGRVGADRMRVYLTAKNLWMNQNLGIDLDPEYPWTVGDYYPQTRVFSIGTDISF